MRERQKGFSVVELMVSTAMVLVLSVVSLPMANTGVERYRLYNDAQRLAAECQRARFLAISTNFSHRLHINGDSVELQKRVNGAYTVVDSFGLSTGVSLASAWAADPIFSPRGTVSTAADVTLASRDGLQRTVRISVLGRVTQQ
ncbi:MAG: hypothetical protein HY648_11560 [Acidobacteria bacterium]|nr:hypothetical protein [Acidobacteriota bacterium]